MGCRGVLPPVKQEGGRKMGETLVQSTCLDNEICSTIANSSSECRAEVQMPLLNNSVHSCPVTSLRAVGPSHCGVYLRRNWRQLRAEKAQSQCS